MIQTGGPKMKPPKPPANYAYEYQIKKKNIQSNNNNFNLLEFE